METIGNLIRTHVLQRTDNRALARTLSTLAKCVPVLERSVRFGRCSTLLSKNTSGNQQKNIDLQARDLIHKALSRCDAVSSACSEEDVAAIKYDVPSKAHPRQFTVMFDPLDGSANMDAGWPVGVIAGIIPGSDWARPGSEMCASFVAMIAAKTLIAYAVRGSGAHVFEVGPGRSGKVFREDVLIDASAGIATMGGRLADYTQGQLALLRHASLRNRNAGCFAAECFNILLNPKGCILAYPTPKLRLPYEILPISLLMAEAGGAAYCLMDNGWIAANQATPQSLHEECGVVIGPRGTVHDFLKFGGCTAIGNVA